MWMARASRAQWQKRVAEWVASGVGGTEFAARLGVKEATLRHWKWQLGNDDRRGGTRKAAASRGIAPRVIEVVMPAICEPRAAALILEVRNGAQVTVPIGFDEETLRRLVRVLEGS